MLQGKAEVGALEWFSASAESACGDFGGEVADGLGAGPLVGDEISSAFACADDGAGH